MAGASVYILKERWKENKAHIIISTAGRMNEIVVQRTEVVVEAMES
jgi:hypothetical protein